MGNVKNYVPGKSRSFCRAMILSAVASVILGLFSAAVFAQAPLAGGALPGIPWFGDVMAPVKVTEEDGGKLCREIFTILNRKSGKVAEFVDERAPRIVFLTWRTVDEQVKIQEGRGRGLAAAVNDAVSKALTRLGKNRIKSLKLDIVQDVMPMPEFIVRATEIPLPSIIGIAFSELSGFAFMPEELVFLGLINGERLDTELIGLSFSKAERWEEFAKWTRISSFADRQLVYLFENQSFYADDSDSFPLFAGQRLVRQLTVPELRRQLTGLADFTGRNIADEGLLKLPELMDDETQPEIIGREITDLEAALGLLKAWKLTGNQVYFTKAVKIIELYRGLLKPLQSLPQGLCLPSSKGVDLGTNSLMAIALARVYNERRDDRELLRTIQRLGLHMVSQLQPGGNFVESCAFPSGWPHPNVSKDASAKAIAALVEVYEVTAEVAFLTAARNGMQPFLENYLHKNVDMAALPQDDWLLAALNRIFTHNRDQRLAEACERIAMAIIADQTTDPVLPNLLGSWKEHPSIRIGARKARALAHALQLLNDSGRQDSAGDILNSLHLYLGFVGQGRMDSITSLYLGTPSVYAGAFREDMLGCRFNLATQAAQLLSLTAALDACARFLKDEIKLPLTERGQTMIFNARQATSVFPRVLLFKHPAAVPGGSSMPAVEPVF